MSHDVYESPLAGRYASPYMLHLFSPDMRFQTCGGCGRPWPGPSTSWACR